MTGAYYNEIDPFAAEWLRQLIKMGEIADGEVDERDIRDVCPDDLRGFTQVHLFAGIGGWSAALRLARWSDDRTVWTASCPCQPFSAAGEGKGFDDPRHLWPDTYWLIEQCRPDRILGEQVAGKDGRTWFDPVSLSLESCGYAVGASVTPACGYGAPMLGQRLYWCGLAAGRGQGSQRHNRYGTSRGGWAKPSGSVASSRFSEPVAPATGAGLEVGSGPSGERPGAQQRSERLCEAGTLATARGQQCGGLAVDGGDERYGGETGRHEGHGQSQPCLEDGGVGTPCSERRQQECRGSFGYEGAYGGQPNGDYEPAGAGQDSRLVQTNSDGCQQGRLSVRSGRQNQAEAITARHGTGSRPGPVNGFWADADWILCNDPDGPRWRAVEPGTFPLASRVQGRVGLVRGYGNAITQDQAAAFAEAVMAYEHMEMAA